MPHLDGEISPREREELSEDRQAFIDFREGISPVLPDDLALFEKKELSDWMPIVRKDSQALLIWLLLDRKPGRILEIGTATGFSAILMARYTPSGTKIVTIENYAPRIRAARENIRRFGCEDRIVLMEADAADALRDLSGEFDLIFLDGPKGQYPSYLSRLLELLSDRGIMVTDDVLQNGDIMKERSMIRHRDRTIYDRMNMFLNDIINNDSLNTVILQTGDGMALTTWKQGRAHYGS